MTKKAQGTRDHRSEPDDSGTGENFRVDRVFATPRPATAPPRPATAGTPRRPTPSRSSTAENVGQADSELSLRRQLSRLQRQLAEAQRELANKDDELAGSVEKRLEVAAAYEDSLAQLRAAKQQIDELTDDRARIVGVEQRLQDSIAAADELTHQLERERAERRAMSVQFDEAATAFERARSLWKDESALAEEQHVAELARLELAKRAAIEAAEKALEAQLERQREAHEDELEEIRGAHERSLAALRGQLEPKVAEARSLHEEIERLNSEISAVRSEQLRELAERNELHKWELQQQAEASAAELEAKARAHAGELAKLTEQLDTKSQALVQAERNGELREALWEQTAAGLRESQKKLQQELAEAKERCAQSDAGKWGIEQRLVSTLQTMEALGEEKRLLESRLDEALAEAHRNELDRERFAAYLEEGLAMLGALPPSAESAPVAAPTDPDEHESAAAEPEHDEPAADAS